LNYGACTRYLDLLLLLRWVRLSEVHLGLICLTQAGREFIVTLERTIPDDANSNRLLSSILSQRDAKERERQVNLSVLDNHRRFEYAPYGSEFHERDSTSHGNVMLIEDEQDVLLTYELYLTELGYTVYPFSDPREALQQFENGLNERIDLILSDIRMKSINGIQLYRELKSISPDIRIIFISALDAAPELTSIIPDFRKDDLVLKPLDQNTLSKVVQAAILPQRGTSSHNSPPQGQESPA